MSTIYPGLGPDNAIDGDLNTMSHTLNDYRVGKEDWWAADF